MKTDDYDPLEGCCCECQEECGDLDENGRCPKCAAKPRHNPFDKFIIKEVERETD